MHSDHPSRPSHRYLAALSLGALGVVYGDIGTSPLYAMRESFRPEHGVTPDAAGVLGVLSLILWSLIVVITIKYLVFVLRADNRGEGGILALTSLVTPLTGDQPGNRRLLILLGLFGTALLYGDGMITPAISVLSAVEGLVVATPVFEPYVLPLTMCILIALFMVQKRGTAGIGKVFGIVTLVWFVTLGGLGILWIAREPSVLHAVSPVHAVRFFVANGFHGFLVLGSVFLVVTGGEALYADMGHFGRTPIRIAWFIAVLPSLLLNYFGQGALIIRDPSAIDNPFYHMVPSWGLYPAVFIAAAATVIASQALISGAFSLTMQAVQLGYCPRVEIRHTSDRERGQIYIPYVNWGLMICCLGLVLGFRSSSALAAAYGIAVTTTMVITTVLFYVVARERWKWSRVTALLVTGSFMVIDLAFWAANVMKIPDGGWFPLLVGVIIFTLLTTWKAGRRLLGERLHSQTLPRELFVKEVLTSPPTRVDGTAVFMYSNPAGTPPALLHNLKHNKVLHSRVIFLSVQTAEVPYVDVANATEVQSLGGGLYQVVLTHGFMENVDVPARLALVECGPDPIRTFSTTYFLGREILVPSRRRRGMAFWRERLFTIMADNSKSAGDYFCLPPNRVVELSAVVEL
jgi:KUP system potassium uptake protein